MNTTPSIDLLSKTLSKLKPGDGYVATLLDQDKSVGVYFNLRLDDQYVRLLDTPKEKRETLTLGFWAAPDEFQRGEAHRLQLLADAVARFFNTGGCWNELGVLFSCLQKNGVGSADHMPYQLIKSFLAIAVDETVDADITATYSYVHAYAPTDKPLEDTTPIIEVNESTGVCVVPYKEFCDDGE